MPHFVALLSIALSVAAPALAQQAASPSSPPQGEPAGASGAVAETTAPAPPVEDLVAEALARAPLVAARAAALAAQRQRQLAAGVLADPQLEGMLQNAGVGWSVGEEEMSMLSLQLRQAIPWPGRRAAARQVAAAETVQQEATLAALRRRVALEVRTLYAGIYVLDRERETLLASRELVDLLTETARSRYATGGAGQEGVLAASVQRLRVEERLGDLEAERQALLADLNRWLDRAGSAPLGAVTTLPAPASPAADVEARAAMLAPEVVEREAALRTAEQRVRVARLALAPALSASAGAGYRGSRDPMLLAGVGLELPLWKRQKQLPLLRAAEVEVERARRELDDARSAARAEAAKHVAMLRLAERQALLYREGLVPQVDASFDAARSSYLAGRGDFSTVLDDFQLWLDARVALARREADRYAAWATLEHHVAATPDAFPPHAEDHP